MTRAYVFDAYGTLFDVHAAAGRHSAEIGPHYECMSQIWRQKHLEYTWIHAQTQRPIDFWTLTQRSLDFAIASIGGVPAGVRDKLLGAYRKMSPFADVPEMLADLRSKGKSIAILSNGDPDMLDDAVAGAGLGGAFDQVLSIKDVGVFKPAKQVYQLACDRLGVAPAEVTFLSSNRWDIAGAQVFGFKTIWVNRSGAPDEYPDMRPDQTVRDLRAVAKV